MPKTKKRNAGLGKPATKGDIEELRTSQQKIVNHLDKMEKQQKQYKDEIINAFKAETESQRTDLFGAHKDELDIVTGEKDAPVQWKTIPRRLLTVEMAVDKIKDHLEIS